MSICYGKATKASALPCTSVAEAIGETTDMRFFVSSSPSVGRRARDRRREWAVADLGVERKMESNIVEFLLAGLSRVRGVMALNNWRPFE
jgi:hypothetical protein